MKGILLAGGLGTRLHPITKCTSKQLLPLYDKPIIYYSLSTLMLAGIKEVAIISTPCAIESYKNLIGNGENFGLRIEYIEQQQPKGIAHGLLLAEKFVATDDVCLILGDNFFWGQGFTEQLKQARLNNTGCTIFTSRVKNAQQYGILELDENGNPVSIEEKPKKPKSNLAVTGLYMYTNDVFSIARQVIPSKRGEMEISDVNNTYLKNKKCVAVELGRGLAWLDTGTVDDLLTASIFVQSVQNRQNLKIGCLEEIALNNGWITREKLMKLIDNYGRNEYASYLSELLVKQI